MFNPEPLRTQYGARCTLYSHIPTMVDAIPVGLCSPLQEDMGRSGRVRVTIQSKPLVGWGAVGE